MDDARTGRVGYLSSIGAREWEEDVPYGGP